MANNKLIPVRMRKEDIQLPEVQAFRCGIKPHETPLAEWIRIDSADAIARGWKLWLYRLQSEKGPLVGYSSFTTGKIKTTEEDNRTKEIKVFEIPMLALHEDYWGKPKGVADLEEKYSRQIVRHLQGEARLAQERGNGQRQRLLTLYVHPNAQEAQNFYAACGFTFAPGRFLPDPDIPPDLAPGFLGMNYSWE